MIYTETVDIRLVIKQCPVCGVFYAIPERMDEQKQTRGGNFYCPNGHSLVYTETEFDLVKKQLQQTKEQLRREEIAHEATGNRLRATKGVVTKLKKRARNGVCPCCHRYFDNLRRHMDSKHPDFETEQA